jgi:hypothetical protein
MRPFISVLLIVVFSVSLVSDIVFAKAQSTHVSEELNSLVSLGSFDSSASVSFVDSLDESSAHDLHCADPCHVGVSHFGHSAMLLVLDSPRLPVESGIGFIPRLQSEVMAPYLEGLRRPPRLS